MSFEFVDSTGWAAGYRVLVLTVDVPVNGHPERDVRDHFTVPWSAHPRLLLDMVRDHGEMLITQRLAYGRDRNSPIAMHSD